MQSEEQTVTAQLDECANLAEKLFLTCTRPMLIKMVEALFEQNKVPNYIAIHTEMAWNHITEGIYQLSHQDIPIDHIRAQIGAIRNELNYRIDNVLSERLELVLQAIAEEKSKTAKKQ